LAKVVAVTSEAGIENGDFDTFAANAGRMPLAHVGRQRHPRLGTSTDDAGKCGDADQNGAKTIAGGEEDGHVESPLRINVWAAPILPRGCGTGQRETRTTL